MKICRCCGAQYEPSQDPNVCAGCTNLEIPERSPDDDRRPITLEECRKAAANFANDLGPVFGSRKQGLEFIEKMAQKMYLSYGAGLLLLLLAGCHNRIPHHQEVLMPRPIYSMHGAPGPTPSVPNPYE